MIDSIMAIFLMCLVSSYNEYQGCRRQFMNIPLTPREEKALPGYIQGCRDKLTTSTDACIEATGRVK